MVYETFYGAQEHFWGWRCIGCGDIVDEVILENRNWTKAGRQRRGKRKDVILNDIEAGN
jgi:hypothetical protein